MYVLAGRGQSTRGYAQRIKEGIEVVIAHPKLVETGLDLLWFPTIYFYETGYSLHTLRQASRRSWRIGQGKPVRVKFFVYEGTAQRTCLRLMGKKMLVALMMEGKFSGEGLHSMDADEDMMAAMARDLVEKGGVGESADAVWQELRRERGAHIPAPAVIEEMILPIPESVTADLFAQLQEPSAPVLVVMESGGKKRVRPALYVVGDQMRLFG